MAVTKPAAKTTTAAAKPAAAAPTEPAPDPVFLDVGNFEDDGFDDTAGEPEAAEDDSTPVRLVAVLDDDGKATRLGIVVDDGREPNLQATDATGRSYPEGPEPVIAWFVTEAPSPYGGPITDLSL